MSTSALFDYNTSYDCAFQQFECSFNFLGRKGWFCRRKDELFIKQVGTTPYDTEVITYPTLLKISIKTDNLVSLENSALHQQNDQVQIHRI